MTKTLRVDTLQAETDLAWEARARKNRKERKERAAANALDSVQTARKMWSEKAHTVDEMDAKQVTIAWQDAAEAVNKAKTMQEVELAKVAEKSK